MRKLGIELLPPGFGGDPFGDVAHEQGEYPSPIDPCFSDAELDRKNEAIMHAVNAGGDVFLSHTKLHGRFTLRLAIGNIRTEERHVALAWQRLNEAAAAT